MGQIHQPFPVLLFMAVFSSLDAAFPWARQQAEACFGPIELESEAFPFESFTDYYAPTMGKILPKRLWGFQQLIDPSELPKIKRQTNEWESEFQTISEQKTVERPLNMDPGYIDLGKLILASTKDHAHRIYLSDGIFAETTLLFVQKKWKPLPWSYPDYQSEGYMTFLSRCRDYLKSKRIVSNT
ncbi:MAG: DUF4416 family protein [Planctomycetaceae bacterium]|jgi:hypothetical protein|nr:DUF4416 family protein [Planctomycetaceae bacterium]